MMKGTPVISAIGSGLVPRTQYPSMPSGSLVPGYRK